MTPVSMTFKQSQKPSASHNVLQRCTRAVAHPGSPVLGSAQSYTHPSQPDHPAAPSLRRHSSSVSSSKLLPWFLMASWEEGSLALGFSSIRASAAAAAICASSVGA